MRSLRLKVPDLALAVALLFFGVACGSKKDTTPVGISGVSSPVAQFSYDSLDERAVSSDSMRGKVSVLAFVTTYDLASQALVNFVIEVSKNTPDANFAMVAIEDRAQRELVEGYRDGLRIKFPVALCEMGKTGFGEVRVPTTIVLDPSGKIAFRKEGIVKGDELHKAIDSASVPHP